MGTPATTPGAPALTDSTDEPIDAMDLIDDDASSDSEDAHAAAAETVDQGIGARAERSDPIIDSSTAAPSESTPEETHAAVEASSALEAPATSSGQTSSTLPEPQGRPEQSRGTTSSGETPSTGSGQAVPDPDAQ
jgi:hypothetical protein